MAKVRGIVATRNLTGKIVHYNGNKSRKGRAYVTNHMIFTEGGLSNWVTFRYIEPNGDLGREGGDYDKDNNFVLVTTAVIRILN